MFKKKEEMNEYIYIKSVVGTLKNLIHYADKFISNCSSHAGRVQQTPVAGANGIIIPT